MNTLRFCPSEPSKLLNLRRFLDGHQKMYAGMNWCQHKRAPKRNKRGQLMRKPEPLNRANLINIFQTLHKLSCHSPRAVEAKWRPAADRFMRHHMGNIWRQSTRFHNTRTAGAWL